MANEQLTAIEQRMNAATPAPWVVSTNWGHHCINDVNGDSIINDDGGYMSSADAAFVAAARSDVPALVGVVKKMRTLAQSWLALAASYDANPRYQGEAETLRNCANDLARTLDAALAGDEPARSE